MKHYIVKKVIKRGISESVSRSKNGSWLIIKDNKECIVKNLKKWCINNNLEHSFILRHAKRYGKVDDMIIKFIEKERD